MKKRSRDLAPFSLSAIDLFACATGAFLLLAIVLFQYYLKAQQVPKSIEPPPPVVIDPNASLEEKIVQLQEALDAAHQRIAEAQMEKRTAEARLEEAREEAAQSRQLAFLGIVTQAKSFVILIDLSGSMADYEKIMVTTVGELLDQMDASYRCQIIGFQGHKRDTMPETLTRWQPAGQTIEMTPVNLQSARSFSNGLVGRFRSGTPTYLALRTALDYEVEAIFLLTDGAPNDIEDWHEIVRRITRENGGRKKIYCVAIGDYRDEPGLVAFLETLAKENGGQYLGVSN
jgi:Mg-chelatase subunit ChlD